MLELLAALQKALLDLAEAHVDTIMPGFTHLQVAQPVTFGHHLLAYVAMLARDAERFADARRRINRLPLGAAALAGTSYPIDRAMVARELGFDDICDNSLDAVSDRDFAIEFCSAASLLMMHLSRFSEELIMWMSPRVGFIELSDRYCTGSSIMPQKKNPDVPELIRGKTGRVYGHLVALLTLGWSLNYEILFYLVYFIALKISHQHRLLISSVLLVALTQVHGFAAPESMLAFWSDAYIIEFIYGMLLANLVSSPQSIENARLPISAALLAFAAFCYLLLPSSGLVTPAMALDKWVRVLVIGLPSAALVMLTLAAEQSVRRLPQMLKNGINFLGELSYPIYIFHIYVMGVLKRLGALDLGMPAYVAAVAGATLLASALVYLLYEQPARKLLSRAWV